MNLRLKRVPTGTMFFGLELGHVPYIGRAQKTLVYTARKAVGELYGSWGHAPDEEETEEELPTFVMPLWAFDQFAVSDPENKPDLATDISRLGVRRTDGVKQYKAAVSELMSTLSTDKIYTFCFWGVSRFLDVVNWEGGWTSTSAWRPPLQVDFGDLPFRLVLYEKLDGGGRPGYEHPMSRRLYYVRMAVWTHFRPVDPTELARFIGAQAAESARPDVMGELGVGARVRILHDGLQVGTASLGLLTPVRELQKLVERAVGIRAKDQLLKCCAVELTNPDLPAVATYGVSHGDTIHVLRDSRAQAVDLAYDAERLTCAASCAVAAHPARGGWRNGWRLSSIVRLVCERRAPPLTTKDHRFAAPPPRPAEEHRPAHARSAALKLEPKSPPGSPRGGPCSLSDALCCCASTRGGRRRSSRARDDSPDSLPGVFGSGYL